jgi:hypothetical protein
MHKVYPDGGGQNQWDRRKLEAGVWVNRAVN